MMDSNNFQKQYFPCLAFLWPPCQTCSLHPIHTLCQCEWHVWVGLDAAHPCDPHPYVTTAVNKSPTHPQPIPLSSCCGVDVTQAVSHPLAWRLLQGNRPQHLGGGGDPASPRNAQNQLPNSWRVEFITPVLKSHHGMPAILFHFYTIRLTHPTCQTLPTNQIPAPHCLSQSLVERH